MGCLTARETTVCKAWKAENAGQSVTFGGLTAVPDRRLAETLARSVPKKSATVAGPRNYMRALVRPVIAWAQAELGARRPDRVLRGALPAGAAVPEERCLSVPGAERQPKAWKIDYGAQTRGEERLPLAPAEVARLAHSSGRGKLRQADRAEGTISSTDAGDGPQRRT